MLECHDLGFGMAPSLLGGNGEAGLSAKRYSPTVLDNDGVLLANLSKADVIELLFVNSSDDLIKVTWQKTIQPMLSWFNSKGELVDFTDLTIKQRDWIRGVDNA